MCRNRDEPIELEQVERKKKDKITERGFTVFEGIIFR